MQSLPLQALARVSRQLPLKTVAGSGAAQLSVRVPLRLKVKLPVPGETSGMFRNALPCKSVKACLASGLAF